MVQNADRKAVVLEFQHCRDLDYVAPVVRQAADGEHELVNLSWGSVFLQQGRASRPVTHSPSIRYGRMALSLSLRAQPSS